MLVLNSFHPQIQFTYEKEIDLKINFLDVSLVRNGQKLSTKVIENLQTPIFYPLEFFRNYSIKESTWNMSISRAYIVSFKIYYKNS